VRCTRSILERLCSSPQPAISAIQCLLACPRLDEAAVRHAAAAAINAKRAPVLATIVTSDASLTDAAISASESTSLLQQLFSDPAVAASSHPEVALIACVLAVWGVFQALPAGTLQVRRQRSAGP
jgi:hypothetical protein